MAPVNNNGNDVLRLNLQQKGRERILSALHSLNTPAFGSFKLSQLGGVYKQLYKNDMNSFELDSYFNMTNFVDVAKAFFSDVLSVRYPVTHADPIFDVVTAFKDEIRPNAELVKAVAISASPPDHTVRQSSCDPNTKMPWKADIRTSSDEPRLPHPAPPLVQKWPHRRFTTIVPVASDHVSHPSTVYPRRTQAKQAVFTPVRMTSRFTTKLAPRSSIEADVATPASVIPSPLFDFELDPIEDTPSVKPRQEIPPRVLNKPNSQHALSLGSPPQRPSTLGKPKFSFHNSDEDIYTTSDSDC